jgi:hypothetical protein
MGTKNIAGISENAPFKFGKPTSAVALFTD